MVARTMQLSTYRRLVLMLVVLVGVASCSPHVAPPSVAPLTASPVPIASPPAVSPATLAASADPLLQPTLPASAVAVAAQPSPQPATPTARPTRPPTPTLLSTPTPSPTATPLFAPDAKVLRVIAGEPDIIDPQQASFATEFPFIMLNYLPLLTYDTNLNLKPGAAASYIVSPDGLVYTFTLRPNQRYSDGVPLTAHNFEYALKRFADPLVGGEYQAVGYPIAGFSAYADAILRETDPITEGNTVALQQLRDAVGVKALDDHTLEIRLVQPASYFPHILALWVAVPTRRDLVEQGGEEWWRDPKNYVGNGPFQLTSWASEQRAGFERNPHYALADNQPMFDGVELVLLPYDQSPLGLYQQGALDITHLSYSELATIADDLDLQTQVVQTTDICTFFLAFNVRIPPFDRKDVRQAIAYALDREGYLREGEEFGRFYTPTLSLLPPGVPGHNPDEQRFDFDPVRAKELLSTAGYTESLGSEIKLESNSSRNDRRLAWLKQQLHTTLGISLPLEKYEYKGDTWTPPPPPPMSFSGWCGEYPDPHDYLYLRFRSDGSTAQRFGWSNAQFDALVDEAERTVDSARRLALYRQAEDILIEEQPVSFLSNNVTRQLQNPRVTGIRRTPFDWFPGIFSLNTIKIDAQ